LLEIRNGQKRPDLSQEEKEPTVRISEFPAQTSLSSSPLNGEQTPYPGGASDKSDVNKYSNSIFGDNLLTDNMDYINSLLKDQFMDAPPVKNTQKRNKRITREDLKVAAGSGLRRPTGELISPVKIDSAISPPVNSPNLEGNSSLLSPSEPDLKDKIEGLVQVEISEGGESEIKLKGGRNNSDMISKKDVEAYENYYPNGMNNVGKRSTSMEDIRISQKNFSLVKPAQVIETPRRSILEHLENIPGQDAEETPVERSSLQIPLDRSPQSVYNDNSNMSRAEFASSLNQYIEYFQKSEAAQYRSIKASQYFSHASQRANTQRSAGQHILTTGTTPNNEVETLKNQVKKLKAKVEDLQLMNELLAQERKSVKKREQELIDRAENAEAELGNYKKKTKQYRERLRNTEDLLKKEKIDNENNLMALRRVLSNNINNVLEYKINTYMKSGSSKTHHRGGESNSIFTSPDLHHYDKIKLAKDKEKRKNYSTNPNGFFPTAGTNIRTQGSIGNITETLGNLKNYSKNNNGLKEKVSPVLQSNKDQSFSDEDELKALQKKFGALMRGDGYFEDQVEEEFLKLNKRMSQYSMQQSDFDSSSEPADETDLSGYGVSKYEANKKVQQIKKLQDQLAKLIEQEEPSANDISGYTKSVSQRNINVNVGKKHKGHTNSLFDHVNQKQNNFLNMISSESKYDPRTRTYSKGLGEL